MEYTIILYQIDSENIKYKKLVDYITEDLSEFNPNITIGKFDATFNIRICDKYQLVKCFKIINNFIKYKNHCKDNYGDDICIYIEIR